MLGNVTPMKARALRRLLAWVAAAAAVAAVCGCKSSGSNKTAVSISPAGPFVLINQTMVFTVMVTGPTNTDVSWSGPTGTGCTGTPNPCGTLSGATHNTTGTNTVTYTAPSIVPNPSSPPTITITATSVADPQASGSTTLTIISGITITINPSSATLGTGESFKFTATVANDSQNLGVTWSVSETNGGTITPDSVTPLFVGDYTAPSAVPPSPGTATIVATAKADTNRTANAVVTIVTAGTPTLSSISPHLMPQGGIHQDLYLTGTNLLSTTTVCIGLATGPNTAATAVPVSQITVASTSAIRVRLADTDLQAAQTHYVQIVSQAQGECPSSLPAGAPTYQVVPVRPGLVSTAPASALQQSTFASSITIDGGYFGPVSSPVVSASFDGSTHSFTPVSARRFTMHLAPSDLSVPGLHPLAVQNSSATPSMAVTNVAVQPDPKISGSTPSLLGPPIPMPGTNPTPSAIAMDSTLGRAIVVLNGTNQAQLLDVIPGSPPTVSTAGTISVGNAPTGVAVDYDVQSAQPYHHGVVVNSTGQSVTIVDLQDNPDPVLGTIDLSGITPAGATPILPFSVGIDPSSHLGLVAYSSTNTGSIINVGPSLPAGAQCILGTAPYCVVGEVTINTGGAPQIAFEPHLRWAVVTPGGAGLMSIVNLKPQTPIVLTSAVRAGNVVTVTTATPHGIAPMTTTPPVITSVLVAGVTDNSFNGTFTVSGVPSPTTFTYSQTGSGGNSSGGTVTFSYPLASSAVSATARGIAINPETYTAVVSDQNVGNAYVISTLDQISHSVRLVESSTGGPVLGGVSAAFQPYTNVAAVVSNTANELFLIDPTAPGLLGGSTVSLGTNPIPTGGTGSSAVAIDPPTNLALVANSTSNDVSVISLGPIKQVHISDVLIPLPPPPIPPLPAGFTYTSASDLPIRIFGSNFSSGAMVLLDGANAASGTVANNGRELDATIPSSFLGAPRRYALQVDSGGEVSNAEGLSVVQSIDFSGSCATPQLAAVAIDADRDLAVVTNAGCNNVSLIDLTGVQAPQTVAVGTAPEGVAVIPRLGLAVVTNRNIDLNTLISLGSGTVSLVNLDTLTLVGSDITVGTEPLAVDIDQDIGRALVANFGSNSLSEIDLTVASPTVVTIAVTQQPTALAIDPNRHVAVVLNSSASSLIDVVNLAGGALQNNILVAFATLFTGVAFDPVSGNFYASAADFNTIYLVNPSTASASPVSAGINPGPLAYNYQTGALVAVNPGSSTMTLFDGQNVTPQAVFGPVTGVSSVAQQLGVAIHPRTNLAVVVDQPNNRVLLTPLPK